MAHLAKIIAAPVAVPIQGGPVGPVTGLVAERAVLVASTATAHLRGEPFTRGPKVTLLENER